MKMIDRFIMENIAEGIIAASEEMFISWGRTSQSTIIYEVLDYAAGITDANGNIIGQSNGVTSFLGTLTYSVKSVINKFGIDGLKAGDIILTNDSYSGSGSHPNDVAAVMPIFYEGEIISFAANKGHWNEVGGKELGSWSTDATEVYQEGLQFPIIKIYEQGKLNESVRDMIEANVRTPNMTLGDLYAQTASLKVAEKRMIELIERYGKDAILESIKVMLENGRKLARQELKKLPHGSFEAETYMDTEANGIEDVYIKVKVTIDDANFIMDFTGSGPQVNAPINCTKWTLYSAARVVYRAIVYPHAQASEGFYDPLKIIIPYGTIFSAVRPSPISSHQEPISHITDLVAKAIAPYDPERITAGHFLSILATIIGGIDDKTKDPFILCEPQAGGWGAGINKDGESGLVAIMDGETFIMPVEVAETRYPVIVENYKLNLNSGDGKYRGGFGLIREYRIMNSNAKLTTMASKYRYRPWGINGGTEGSNNKVQVVRDSYVEERATFSSYPLKNNDLVRFITAGGGGYGNAFDRNPEEVFEDVLNEYISVEKALEVYGVVLEKKDGVLVINIEETIKRRMTRN